MGGNTLTLAVKEKPDQRVLSDFVGSHPQLVVDGVLGEKISVVMRRLDGTQSFEVWRPMRAFESNDLQPDLDELVQAPCWTLQISLDSHPPKEDWELANSLARFIAITCEGAVFYNEADKILWPEAVKKKPSWPEKPPLVDLVKLEWFVHLSQPSVSTPGPFLTMLRKLCPEAVPVRFGTVHPLQGRLGDDNDGPFGDLWKQSNEKQGIETSPLGMFQFTGKPPCFGGHVSFPSHLMKNGNKSNQQYVELMLQFDRGPLSTDSNWCEKVVSLFVGVARILGAFYAHSYVERNYSKYRGLFFSPKSDHHPGTEQYPLPMGHEWLGIPPTPTWLLWLGPPYVGLVEESLQKVEHFSTEEGILIRRGPRPMDLDQLQGMNLGFPQRLLVNVMEDPRLKDKQGRWPYRGKSAEFIPQLHS